MDIREHFKKYRTWYVCGVTGVTVAGITCLIMRGVASQPISVAIAGDAASAANVGVAGKKVVMNNVSVISSNRKGSPSWVVRCLETDEVFTSQRKAAEALNIPQSQISEQLSGLRNTARGRTFERICMAA